MSQDTNLLNSFLNTIDTEYKNYKEEMENKLKDVDKNQSIMNPTKRIPQYQAPQVSIMNRDLELYKGSSFYETTQQQLQQQRNKKVKIQEKQNELIASRNNIHRALPFSSDPNPICSFRPVMSNSMDEEGEELSKKYERYCKERESSM
jgi:hypothetical protein